MKKFEGKIKSETQNNASPFKQGANALLCNRPPISTNTDNSTASERIEICDMALIRRQLITEKELAVILGVSPYWCQKSRCRGGGPPYILVGRAVRYHIPSVEAWLQSRIVTSTSQMVEEKS